jgi:hypothetical protein
MAETLKVHINLTEFEVSLLPRDHIDYRLFALKVEYRGDDRWAVVHLGYCLDADGEWDYEPLPSSRDDDWLATHRFPRAEASRRAVRAAGGVTVNGLTASEIAERSRG